MTRIAFGFNLVCEQNAELCEFLKKALVNLAHFLSKHVRYVFFGEEGLGPRTVGSTVKFVKQGEGYVFAKGNPLLYRFCK